MVLADPLVSSSFSNIASPLAILYSGGLDSAVLAALANQHYPTGPLELLTVAFANPRVLAAAAASSSSVSSKSGKEAASQPAKGPYDTPDRITARAGLEELKRIAPEREWRLIEIDVTPMEYEQAKAEIENTMRPADSVVSQKLAGKVCCASTKLKPTLQSQMDLVRCCHTLRVCSSFTSPAD